MSWGPPIFNPHGDHVAPSPIDYEEIPLGAGQEPRPVGHLQHTKQGSFIDGTDVRREPGYEHLVVESRWPERPA